MFQFGVSSLKLFECGLVGPFPLYDIVEGIRYGFVRSSLSKDGERSAEPKCYGYRQFFVEKTSSRSSEIPNDSTSGIRGG